MNTLNKQKGTGDARQQRRVSGETTGTQQLMPAPASSAPRLPEPASMALLLPGPAPRPNSQLSAGSANLFFKGPDS